MNTNRPSRNRYQPSILGGQATARAEHFHPRAYILEVPKDRTTLAARDKAAIRCVCTVGK